jgi:trimeric autotransporter adhesin
MSTKTTFKRVALVAVAALGLGVMTSVAPANAAAKGFALDTTSVTVVGNVASGTALFKITVLDDAAAGGNTALASDETITATIVGVPAGTGAAKTLATNGVWGNTAVGGVPATQAADLSVVSLTVPTTRTGAYVPQTHSSALTGAIGSAQAGNSDSATVASAVAATNSVYYLGVRNNINATSGTYASIDQGAYQVRLRMTKGSFVLQESTVTVRFVSTAADSGAAITITQTGTLFKGVVDTHTASNNVSVALTNGTAGGRVYVGTTDLTINTPDLSSGVALINTTTGAVISTSTSPGDVQGLLISDAGVIGQDISACTEQITCDLARNNSTYGVYTSAATTLDTVVVTTSTSLRVRYGATQATAVLSFGAQPTATAGGTTAIVTATGMNVLATSGTLAAQRAFKVPLSNKSVTYTISTTVPDAPFIFTTTWSGAWAAADVTPVSGTTGRQTVRTDANGRASITLTNANPRDTARATIAITGFVDDSLAVSQTITWEAPVVTTVAVTPGSYTAALKSTNTLTATVLDQYGAPMAGEVLAPVFAGTAATSANFQAAPATITTDARGSARFTWTDAGATATVATDAISFRALSNGTSYTGSTVTYSATAATAASFKSYYSHTESATTASTLVPATGVYVGTSTELLITQARNNGTAISLAGADAATNDLVFYYVQALTSANAAAARVPVTITAPAGAFIVNSSGLQTSSTTAVTDINGYVGFVGGSNKTGAITFTFTAGTATGSVAQWVANATAGGRFVTLTGPATGTANAEPNLYTGSVTDRHGNPVAGVSVTINAGGASSLGGGSTAATYVTLADGKFTFTGTSFVSAGGTGTYTATATTAGDYSSAAGFVSTTPVDASLKAGNQTASVSVTWGAGNSAAADTAQAAADAAAEATDAANAATDAANAAAEAADAATAAAQDAADAVAALSTSVSAMVADLKRQITALTNLVIKIQRKVRA